MRRQFYNSLLVLCFLISGTPYLHSQSCPINLDFESGSFTNWQYRKGLVRVENSSNQNKIDWLSSTNTPPLLLDGLEMIGPNDASLDSVGRFPRHSPNGSAYSVRLGNNKGGNGADGIFYTLTIPATANRFSILYNYAVVLEKPTHSLAEQPRFRARIVDVATNQELNCVSFDFIASATLPGFVAVGDKVYKDWTPVSVDLSSYRGKVVRLELITSDCTQNQHFGYAYVDVNAECDGKIKGSTFCQGDSVSTLTAPFGYQSYAWYSDTNYNQVVSNSQYHVVNIATTSPGTVLPVIITPYPSFGCTDTLYAIISTATKPISQAGPNQVVCSRQSVQLGMLPQPGNTYAWSPTGFIQNPNVSNPLTRAPITGSVQVVVKTTDIASGCFSYDTALITPKFVDTATGSSGKLLYCPGETIQASLFVTNPSTQVQWLLNNQALTGSTGPVLQASSSGRYQAQIKQDGCIDTSRSYNIQYYEKPVADFELGRPSYCVSSPVMFLNKSTIAGNESLTYRWRFSDGDIQQSVAVSKLFTRSGEQWATLMATSANNCVDSVRKVFAIVSICEPLVPTAFTPNGDGYNERLLPHMLGVQGLKRFAVYNRYGKTIFTTNTENTGWDGTLNGQPLPAGAYVWQLEYTDAFYKPAMLKGTTVLIR